MLSAFNGVFGPFWRVPRLYGYFITFCALSQIRAVSGPIWAIPWAQCRIDRNKLRSARLARGNHQRVSVSLLTVPPVLLTAFCVFWPFCANPETQSPVDGPVLHVLTGKNPRQ